MMEANPKVARHKQLCDELNALYARKNADYGDSFHQTFIEEGYAMARIRLSDKLSRFKTLSRKREIKGLVSDEGIKDTLIDLANYALMTILEIEEVEMAKRDEGRGAVIYDETGKAWYPYDIGKAEVKT